MERQIIAKNKKAYFDFHIFDKYEAGIVLTGTEIKSVRKNNVNLKDSFVRIESGEVFLYNCHISPFEHGNRYNHDPLRTRKLLLSKKEILKIDSKVKKDGYTIVPLEIYIFKGFAKVEIALAKGKKLHDKREDLAKKDQKREIDRLMKR
ncbi:SsrA-binding protein SmpB [bacterium]|nr:SsrA-binding protein SmpB [bacterium]